MRFELHIGIRYSGAETSECPVENLRVHATGGGPPGHVVAVPDDGDECGTWSRAGIARYLVELAASDVPYVAGIDHGFSFPLSYFERYGLASWDAMLEDFQRHWPGHDPHTRREFVEDEGSPRGGWGTDFRLCERWTAVAWAAFARESGPYIAVFRHAGLPWLCHVRERTQGRVHFWPFDGWDVPEGRSVVAEVFPSILRNRYPREGRSRNEQDAYAVARWLSETCERGFLGRYLDPPLTAEESRVAELEGWILGVT